VSLYGTAEITQDRALIDELWQEAWRVWFPDGKQSADLCLLRVAPTNGEYWDVSGQREITFVFDAVKAYVTGTKPERREEDSAKVDLH
jgi:general stress protein 26